MRTDRAKPGWDGLAGPDDRHNPDHGAKAQGSGQNRLDHHGLRHSVFRAFEYHLLFWPRTPVSGWCAGLRIFSVSFCCPFNFCIFHQTLFRQVCQFPLRPRNIWLTKRDNHVTPLKGRERHGTIRNNKNNCGNKHISRSCFFLLHTGVLPLGSLCVPLDCNTLFRFLFFQEKGIITSG